ncbi:MAG: Ig-like domain-containing protein [Bacteroidota bacterium]
MVLYKEYCQLWGAAAYLTTNRTVNKPTLFQNMKTSIINSAIAEEAGLINSRPTRRAVYESTSFWQTVHDVNRTIIAHAITDDPAQKADFLKALLFEADWGLGRNPLNIIQMTTASTNLHLNKSLENIFTTGADDGAPGQHPGHTPYLSLTDFGGNSVADKTSLLLATCVPNSNDWAVGELYFSTQHVYAHTEFTPQQTMRGKQALYGYLYGLSNGRTNAPSTYKLTVEGGSGSGNLASGATRTISAGSGTNGQVFKEWISNSRYVLDYYVDDPRSATTTVTMPEGNIWLQATYESPKYELTVNGGYGGEFYKAGEEVTIFANTPSNGQKFNQWQGNASNFSFPASNANQSAAAKIIMPAQDITYTGLFNNGQETYATCGELENVSFERSFFTFGQTNITMSTEARTDDWAVQGLGGPAIFKNGIDASGHNSYELTIWVKSIGDVNGSSVGLDFIDAGGAEVGKEFINVASDPDWQELSILGGIPNGTVEVRFWTWVNQGNILYDDICLVFDGNPNFNPVTGVTMTPNALTFNVGESSQLNTQIQPSNATNQGLTYTSSNTNVVTVSSTGFVDAIGGGVATITVTTDEGGYTDQTSVTVNGSNSNQTPYVTHTIPGTIEGEYYDNGGQGVAYNDDATRDGDLSFRPDDKVDVDSKAPASNGKSVGWTVPGEWLEYTISSVSGGTYDITFAFASGATSQGNLQVSLDGNVIATFTDITSTGDWSTFSNTTVSDVAIAGGSNQILRLEVIGSVANFDIDAITFTNTGGGNVPVTSVNLTPTSLTLNIGQSQPLSVNVLPNNATNQAISYSSSNTNVATVNGSGVVTAVGDGNATITVTTDDGGFTDQTSITVNPSNIPVTGVSLSPTNVTLNVGQTRQLTKSVQPSNATNRTVSYTSSNNNVATVNNNGVVNAIAAGNATITVTTADGGFTDQTNVTVNGGGNSGGDLIIRAKGDTGDEIMELRINNTVVKIWSITSSWDTYVYAGYSGVNTIQVAHTNDGLNGDGLDKNMQVDYIETNGTIYQTNQSATLNGGCGDINTEYLWCNAYFEYLGIDGGSGNSNVAVTGVSLTPASITLNVEQTQQLTATVQPSNATNQAVSYASSNTNVATVSGSGVVSATGAGSATITVTTTDGGFTDQTSVTVNTPNVAVTGVNLTPANVTLDVGQTQQLTATVQPSNATNQTVSYASGNTSVATVNASGLVTAVAVGSAPITVTTADGSFTDQTNVTVSSSNSGGDLIIRAKGDTGEETMELQVNDVTVGGWNLTAAWADYTYSGYTGTNDIKVVHTNDGPSSNGGDKNMQADYIQVGGVTYETNQTAVLGGGCGDLNTEYLWCNNTYFLYSNISAGGSANAVENRSKSYDLATVKVYPNPVSSSQIMLDVQELDGIYEINIFDLNGRNVFRQTSNLGKVSISPNLSNGTYLLVLSNQFEVSNHKLIVLNE